MLEHTKLLVENLHLKYIKIQKWLYIIKLL